jgi:Domain of Unknown Function (DUF930)
MQRLALIIGLIVIVATPATARENRFLHSLLTLAPTDRLVQLCDFTVMRRIGKEHRKFRPDRAVAGARAESKISNHTVDAKGGAFRSRGKWYALSYTCTATPDHLKVLEFKYEIGKAIPEDKWAAYGLWQ